MPAPPELRDGARGVGVGEVFRQVKAEEKAEAQGHVAVAGEIKVDLQRVAEPGKPQGRGARKGGGGIDPGGDDRHGVRQQHLLGKPQNKAARAGEDVIPPDVADGELRGNFPVADDGALQQLREEADIQKKAEEVLFGPDLSAFEIDHIGQQLKGGKADGGGQGNLPQAPALPGKRGQSGGEEVQILEEKERPNQQEQREGKAAPPDCRALSPGDAQPAGPDGQRGAEQKRQRARIAPGVKQKGGRQQHAVLPPDVPPEKGEQQHRRQKGI